jgi:hypothetical protein
MIGGCCPVLCKEFVIIESYSSHTRVGWDIGLVSTDIKGLLFTVRGFASLRILLSEAEPHFRE